MLADVMGLSAAARPAQPMLPPQASKVHPWQFLPVPMASNWCGAMQLLNKVIHQTPSRGGPRLHYIVSLTPNAPSEVPARPSIRAAQLEAPAAPATSGDRSDALRSIRERLRHRKR